LRSEYCRRCAGGIRMVIEISPFPSNSSEASPNSPLGWRNSISLYPTLRGRAMCPPQLSHTRTRRRKTSRSGKTQYEPAKRPTNNSRQRPRNRRNETTPGPTRGSSLTSSLKARLSCKRVLITALKLPTS
ncbi:unnamed protein product, partial [Trichogramma brassicae]